METARRFGTRLLSAGACDGAALALALAACCRLPAAVPKGGWAAWQYRRSDYEYVPRSRSFLREKKKTPPHYELHPVITYIPRHVRETLSIRNIPRCAAAAAALLGTTARSQLFKRYAVPSRPAPRPASPRNLIVQDVILYYELILLKTYYEYVRLRTKYISYIHN